MSKIDQLADRIERLLLHYAELQRTNALLEQQLTATLQERESLRSRLNAARQRIHVLLERLPSNPPEAVQSSSPMRSEDIQR
jgi:cell division protein ZapB